MTNIIPLIFLAILLTTPATAQLFPSQALLDKSDSLLKELADMPVGIEVQHNPNPTKARPYNQGKYKYQWSYVTAVQPSGGAVTIQEFGSLTWDGSRWLCSNVTGDPYTASNFAEWYACPDATMAPGTAFADSSNWTASGCLKPGKMRWYYIGTDEQSNRVKGEAVVEQFADLVE